MGRPEIMVPDAPFVHGSDKEQLCRECKLPCQHDTTSVDCFRRFFLHGMLECTYFVYGYCFLVTEPDCVMDNGGRHDSYWLNLLRDYFHNVGGQDESNTEFVRRAGELRQLVEEQIATRQVSLCRYVEEYYHRAMEAGGGISEELMERLDESFLALLAGTRRK